MTITPTPTQPAAVPEALRLADEYAEVRHMCGCHTYNAKTAAARNALIAALSAAAPAATQAEQPGPEDGLNQTLARLDSKALAAWADRGMALAENLVMSVQFDCPLRAGQARDTLRAHLFSAQPSSQVVLTVEQAIAALKIALRDPKGWAQSYSDSLIRDAIDRVPAAPMSAQPVDVSPWAKSRFGVFHPDGRFEELPDSMCPNQHTHPLYHTARWIGGSADVQLLRAFLADRHPTPTTEQPGAEKCPSCRSGDLYVCTCPFPTSRNCATCAAPGGEAPAEDARDAARYRWLRDTKTDVSLVLDKRTGYVPEDDRVPGVGGYYNYEYRAGEELDAAIDAAMAAQGQKGAA